MKRPVLVIFVDALPYDRAINIVNNLKATTYSKTVPGVGYSINVKAELFAGLKPDDVGYFCEWNYDPESKVPRYIDMLMYFLEFFGKRSRFLDRVFHRLIKMYLKENVYAIPYRILPLLKCSGLTAYERDFSRPTVLSKGDFDRVLYSEEGVNDKKVFEEAIKKLGAEKNERLFVSTAELDGVMHHYGKDCEEYESQIKLIEKYIDILVNKFIEIHGDDARYFIFSDHGMAQVTEAVDFDIEAKFGAPGKNSYIYFVDATFYRVWLIDKSLESEMISEFNKIGKGHILDLEERKKFGLVDDKHGDIIYMLDESKQFAPSFFGNDTCQAMHGYEPQLQSQLGMFVSNIDGKHGELISTFGIYNAMKDSL